MRAALPLNNPRWPRAPRGLGRGLVFALAMHALLLLGLSLNINWKTPSPEGLEAELWAAVPQVAAPRRVEPPTPTPTPPPPAPVPKAAQVKPAEPPPPPPNPPAAEPPARKDAQIALEREKKQEAERQAQLAEEQARLKKAQLQAEKDADKERAKEKAQKDKLAQAKKNEKADKAEKTAKAEKAAKAEQEKADKLARQQAAAADKKKQAEEAAKEAAQAAAKEKAEQDAKLAAARDKQLARIMGQAGASGGAQSAGTATQSAGPSANYIGRLKGRIRPNIIFTELLEANPPAEVQVKLAPDGRILSSRITKSSGVKSWDDAVLRALERTEVLPRDEDGRVQPTIDFTFRPRDF